MSFLLNRISKALIAGTVVVSTAFAGTNPRITVKPQVRIVEKVDNTKLVTVANTHSSRINGLADMGRVSGAAPMNHLMLVLKSSAEQEFALQGLMDQQQDKTSPNYHQWLTPETFGANFGVSSADLFQVTQWLQSAGFTVDEVAKGARIVQFSGTTAQVEAAFHTEMHNYTVDGQLRSSNSTDISLPKALMPVVAGVARLNNFPLKSSMVKKGNAVPGKDGAFYPAIAGSAAPDYTSLSSGSHYVGAADLATIFNTNPLLAAGNTGKGVKIGILGQTDILLGDIQIYRQLFNLPLNNPNFILVGTDPGTIADDGESDLDVELSGGIATQATIDFIRAGITYYGAGIDSAAEYAVENNTDDIISLSYGECESALGAAGNSFYSIVWEQAAAQGQSVFVSTGDSGPATCDSSSAAYARGGYAINGLASTPYSVGVGGTMFDDNVTGGGAQPPYWGPGGLAPYSSALSYIPEIPWNEGLFDKYTGGYGGIVSGGGGISFYYGTPAFQTGYGVPTTDPAPPSGTISANSFQVPGPHRYLPDVSLEAAGGHDGTIFCSEGSCKINSDGTVGGIGVVGGTSVAAPSMAGVQALINQKNGGRQGNPNYYYYKLANSQTAASCVAATYVATAGCSFHDVTTGNTKIPTNSSGSTNIAWNAGAGYDLAVGLGSPDVTNLATNWSKANFLATNTAFTLTPTTSAHGVTANVTVTVTPVTGTGVPTGDVGIVAQALYGGLGFYTLVNGTKTGTLTGLPGGTYNVYAHYGGDTVFGGSNSAPIQVTIGTETPLIGANASLLATNGAFTPSSNFAYGANVYITMGVSPSSGAGQPSGTINLNLTSPTVTLTGMPYSTQLDPNGTYVGNTLYYSGASFDAGLGLAAYGIAGNYPVLPVGVYTATVTYAGDTTFNTVTATPFTFTVGPVTQGITLRAASVTVASGAPATLSATIATISAAAGGLPAGGGTVTFTDNTKGVVLGTATMANGSATITTNLLVTAGAHSVVASYSGDTNYAAVTSTAVTITVGGTATATTLTVTPTAAQVGTTVSLSASVPLGTSGTVYFYDGGAYLGTATLSGTTHLATLNVSTFGAATHNLTAVYNGNTTLDTSTSAIVPLVMSQNTPSVQLSTQLASSTAASYSMNAVLIPSPAGTKPDNPAPTGNINFTDVANGGTQTVLGSAVAAYLPGGYQNYVAGFTTKALVPGYHTLGATYVGDVNYAGANSNTQNVVIGLTTTALTVANSGSVGSVTTTLTAKVTPVIANTATLTGTVSFYNGTTLLGKSTIVGTTSTASLSIPYIGLVSGSFTAVYSGDNNYYTSTSAVVANPYFIITVNPTSLTIKEGTTGSVQVIATTYGGYAGTAPLSCSGLPANSYCTFSYTNAATLPTSGSTFVLPGTNGIQAQQITLTITTLLPHSQGVKGSSLLWLPALMLAGFLGLRRKQLSMRGRQLMVLGILLCGTLATTACSSLSMSTPTGTSTVTVTANGVGTATLSPNIQPTATIALTVQ